MSGAGRLAGNDLPSPAPSAATAGPAATTPAPALSEPEREQALEVLHSERFVDASPEETWATLLYEGTYLCSFGRCASSSCLAEAGWVS